MHGQTKIKFTLHISCGPLYISAPKCHV